MTSEETRRRDLGIKAPGLQQWCEVILMPQEKEKKLKIEVPILFSRHSQILGRG